MRVVKNPHFYSLAKKDSPFILHCEIWPSLFSDQLDHSLAIKDQAQVRAVVNWLFEKDKVNMLSQYFKMPSLLSEAALQNCLDEEGWILGI